MMLYTNIINHYFLKSEKETDLSPLFPILYNAQKSWQLFSHHRSSFHFFSRTNACL